MENVLDRLNWIATAVGEAAEAGQLEQVLENIAHVSRELIHARYAALGVPDDRGGLRFFKFSGLDPAQITKIDHLPHGRGLLGVIMNERQTLRVARMQDDPRTSGFCKGHPSMTSLLGVPIQLGPRLFGMLYLCDREDGQPFSESDQEIIEILAGYAALAIAGSELSEQQKRLTVLEERERIGMELHDGVIQSLYAIGMHLELARISNNLQPADLDRPINDLNHVIEDIRRYILDLKAHEQDRRTVRQWMDSMLSRLHIPPTLHVELDASDDYPPYSPLIFEAICQIANEAVSNVVRHASANQLHILARENASHFEIVITDDGQGFDLAEAHERGGLGLHNIEQRALIYRGQVRIDTAPGKGTRITISIPA